LKGVEGKTLVYAAVGKEGAPNGGIILSSVGAIVIDPPLNPELGFQLNVDALRRSRAFWTQLYADGKQEPPSDYPPVLYVINTTYRGSHTFGNPSFLPRADLIASEKAGRRLADATEVQRMRELLRDEFKVPGLEKTIKTVPTLTFEGRMTIQTPEVEVRCVEMGDCVGEGDAVVYLPQRKILFAGDLVIPGFIPYFQGRTPSVGRWIQALKEMEAWEIEVVVPGHGEVGGKKLIETQRAFLEALRDGVAGALKAGRTQAQAAEEIKVPAFAAWKGYTNWLKKNAELVYIELAGAGRGGQGGSGIQGGGGGSLVQPEGIRGPDGYRHK
jgi:cyclase